MLRPPPIPSIAKHLSFPGIGMERLDERRMEFDVSRNRPGSEAALFPPPPPYRPLGFMLGFLGAVLGEGLATA